MSNLINDTLKEQAREEHEENCNKPCPNHQDNDEAGCEGIGCDAECAPDIEKRYQQFLTKVL